MTADEFVTLLEHYAPNESDLVQRGMPKSLIPEVMQSYRCPKKVVGHSSHEDPVIDLLERYDTSNLEMGLVRLNPEKWKFLNERQGRYVIIGAVDADPLAIDKQTKAVVELDPAKPEFVVSMAASSSEAFLKALIEMVKAEHEYYQIPGAKPLHENQERLRGFALRCARVAGIESDPSFYEMLWGV